MLPGCLALAGELAGQRTDKKEQVPSVLLPASQLLEPPVGRTYQEPADKGGSGNLQLLPQRPEAGKPGSGAETP